MEAKLEQKCSVFIIGNSHVDYTLYPVLERLFKSIQKNKIPCAFLEEAPAERTLAEAIKVTENDIIGVTGLKTMFPELNQYCNKTRLTMADMTAAEEIVKYKVLWPMEFLPALKCLFKPLLKYFAERRMLKK